MPCTYKTHTNTLPMSYMKTFLNDLKEDYRTLGREFCERGERERVGAREGMMLTCVEEPQGITQIRTSNCVTDYSEAAVACPLLQAGCESTLPVSRLQAGAHLGKHRDRYGLESSLKAVIRP